MLNSCPTLQPSGCSPPGSSFHGIFQTGILSELPFPPPTPGSNPHLPSLLRWQADSLAWSYLGIPMLSMVSQVVLVEMQETLIHSESGRSPGGGNGNPLQ